MTLSAQPAPLPAAEPPVGAGGRSGAPVAAPSSAEADGLRALLLQSHDLYWETDRALRITRLDGTALDAATRQTYLGQPLWHLSAVNFSPEQLVGLQKTMAALQPLTDLEMAYRLPNGRLLWLTIHGRPRFDGRGHTTGYHGVARDITALKTSRQAYDDQQALTRELFQRVPGLVFQLRRSPAGWFTFPFASAAMHELFQVDPATAMTDAGPVFARVLPEDLAPCKVAIEASAATLTPWVQNYRVRLPDGRLLWHAANAVPVQEADGSMVWYGFTHDITDRIEAEAQLQRAHEQLRTRTNLMETTLGNLSQGVMMIAPDERVTYYNQRLLELLGLPDSLMARQPTLTQLVDWQFERGRYAPDITREQAMLWGQLHPDQPLSFTPGYVRTTRDGRTIEVKTHVLDTGGWVRTFADVTDYFKARQALERSELHLRALFDAIPDRVWLKDPQGRFIMCNPSAARAYGLSVEQILGQTESALGTTAPAESGHADTDARALHSQAPVLYEQELPLQPGAAAVGVFEVVKRAVFDGHGAPLGVLGMARDVTERKRAEAQIERLAFYDPLTGLCNRRLFHDRLEQALAASARSQQWAAVCFIDLDNFKDLNDTQGHDQGDLLLKQVGQRLQAAVREQDTVARLGGDEFVVLLEGLGLDEAQAALYANAVGETLLDALNHPYELQRGEHHNTPSVGITLFRDHGERIEDVLKRADLAMYQSKSAGRNTVRFFDPAMQEAVQRRSELARDLRDALAHDELVLYSQPVVDGNGTVVGHEALLRWQQAQRGMVSPAEFIPVAERTALILPIGDWVLRHACRHLARWAHDPVTAQWTLAVNLSARQLRQPDFVDSVRAILRETGANPALLKLELTESLLLHDVEDTIVKMTELAREGIRFSLDDFGTGYSSLSYLKRLPLSLLKIDKSFVRDLLTDPNDALIAHTILQLAESLGLEVVAEGVETEGQQQLLQVMGCKAFQGYLFGRPAPM